MPFARSNKADMFTEPMKFLQLRFLPRSVDLALLVLRVWFGVSLIVIAGWMKLTNFSAMAGSFPDPYGLGSKLSLVLLIFAEVVCAAFIAIGLFTRFAALIAGFAMASAFWFGHAAKLTGAGNGQSAFFLLGAFVAILLAGGGRYSIDARMGAA